MLLKLTHLCTYISQAEEQRRRHQIKQGRKTSAGGGENSSGAKRSQAEIAERIGESKCAQFSLHIVSLLYVVQASAAR